jgi:hypothetical protein
LQPIRSEQLLNTCDHRKSNDMHSPHAKGAAFCELIVRHARV